MKHPKSVDRHRFLGTAAKATAAVIAAPYVHTSHAAGKLAVGFWDHRVPGVGDDAKNGCPLYAERPAPKKIIGWAESELEGFMRV